MFDKILLPVDGSNASDRAVHVASDLASRYGAEIIVLNVREYEYQYGVEAAAEGLQDAADLVDRYVRRMKDAGLTLEVRLLRRCMVVPGARSWLWRITRTCISS